jgi:hypothetical protein
MFKLYVKRIQDQRLAHLYEHIVFDYLGLTFRGNNIITGLDGYLIPQTSHDGLITLSLEIVDTKIQEIVEDFLKNDGIAITDVNIKRCIGQVSCEKLSAIEYDLPKVKLALLDAAKQPWQDVSGSSLVDVGHPGEKGRDARSPLFNFRRTPERFEHVCIDYTYQGDQGDAVRLYILDRLLEVGQDEFRQGLAQAGVTAYWKGTSYKRNKKEVCISQELIFPAPARKVEKTSWQTLESTIEQLWSAGLAERLAKRARMYKRDTRDSFILSMIFDLYAHLGVVVGAEDLAGKVTADMVEEVSNNLTMSGRLVEGKPAKS